MSGSVVRYAGRAVNTMRPVKASFGLFGYAPGSILFEIGRTKVLCAVSIQNGVPRFLKGKQRGWLTAEYAMLPTSTTIRTQRDVAAGKQNGRAVEISRLIGRTLRSVIDFVALGERTIYVDCDVLQADAGTRVACITGASLALQMAVDNWVQQGILERTVLKDTVAAISVGIIDGTVLLDLDFTEDSRADADFNIVMTRSGKMVEFQGSAEGAAVAWDLFEQVRSLAVQGIQNLFEEVEQLLKIYNNQVNQTKKQRLNEAKESSQVLFSLKNRNLNLSK